MRESEGSWWCWRGDFAVVVKNRCDSGELRGVRSERVKLFFINQVQWWWRILFYRDADAVVWIDVTWLLQFFQGFGGSGCTWQHLIGWLKGGKF